MAEITRKDFDAITFNAVGRSSEISTYSAFSLQRVSDARSGFSLGVFQWDFGQRPNSIGRC